MLRSIFELFETSLIHHLALTFIILADLWQWIGLLFWMFGYWVFVTSQCFYRAMLAQSAVMRQ